MDAIELLVGDHEKIRGLLAKLAETTSAAVKTRTELLAKVRKELEIHTSIEEEIFYPAYREASQSSDDRSDRKSEDSKLYFEALEEHRAAGELVLPDLMTTDVATDCFGGRAKVLKELVEHHAEEEETDMFKRARKLLGKERLAELGERMQRRKHELGG